MILLFVLMFLSLSLISMETPDAFNEKDRTVRNIVNLQGLIVQNYSHLYQLKLSGNTDNAQEDILRTEIVIYQKMLERKHKEFEELQS